MTSLLSVLHVLSDTLLLAQIKLASPLLAIQEGVKISRPENDRDEATVPTNLVTEFRDISNLLIFLTGALAVIVLIFGGLRYVTSTGDAARVKQAKDTIMYGLIGVVVAILAFAIVNFVVDSFN